MNHSALRIAVLGLGSMGRSFARGILQGQRGGLYTVSGTVRSAASATQWSDVPGVTVWATEDDPDANRRAVNNADLIIMAVKPVGVLDLVKEIAPTVDRETPLVSFAAGVPISRIQQAAPSLHNVFRCMPNLPVEVGKGISGICAAPAASEKARARVAELCGTVGTALWVEEHQLHAVTGVSGSGPAYVFYLIEQLAQSFTARGLSHRDATVLAQSIFSEAAARLEQAGAEPSASPMKDLLRQTPAAAAALDVLRGQDLESLWAKTMSAAITRSQEIENSR